MLPSRWGIVFLLVFVCVLFSQVAAISRCDNKYMYYDTLKKKCKPCQVCYSWGTIEKQADCPTAARCRVYSGVFRGCPELEYITEDKPVNCSGYSLNDLRIFDSTCHVQCNETGTIRLVCHLKIENGKVTGRWLPTLPSCVRHIYKPPGKVAVESLPSVVTNRVTETRRPVNTTSRKVAVESQPSVVTNRVTETRRPVNTTAQKEALSSPEVSQDQKDEELPVLTIILIAVSFGIVTIILVSVIVRKKLVSVILRKKPNVDLTEGLDVEEPPEGNTREPTEHEDVTVPLNQGEIDFPRGSPRNPRLSIPLSEPSEEYESLSSLGIERDDEEEFTQPKVRTSEPVQAGWSCESCSSLSSPGSTLLYSGGDTRGDSSTSGVGSGQSSLTSSKEPVESSDSAVVTSSGISYDSHVSNALLSNRILACSEHPRYSHRTPTQHPGDVSSVRNLAPQENEDSVLEPDMQNIHLRDIELQTMVDQYDSYDSDNQVLGQHLPDRTINGTTVVPGEHSCYSQGSVRPDSGSLVPYGLTRAHRGTNMATEHACHSGAASHLNSLNDN